MDLTNISTEGLMDSRFGILQRIQQSKFSPKESSNLPDNEKRLKEVDDELAKRGIKNLS